jgi:hypothetical protein
VGFKSFLSTNAKSFEKVLHFLTKKRYNKKVCIIRKETSNMSKQIDHQDNQEEVKKVVTRYERRLEKRKKEEQKQQVEKRVAQIVGLALVAVLLVMLISFPIRSYMALHETYLTVDGEKISRLEYDYNYYTMMNNYVSQYGTYLSYMGLDMNQDLANQMYTDTMSWKDYFDQLSVESIKQNRALMKDAAQKGFTYDTAEDFKVLQKGIENQAKEQSMTEKVFVQNLYGPLATIGRVSPYLKDTLFLTAYYEQLNEELAPTDEEITTYYEEHKAEYDSVDYRFVQVDAVLPTGPDGGDVEEGAEATEEVYQPTEEEITEAMAKAKEEADAILPNISTEGTLRENEQQTSMVSTIREWMFDSERKEGDTNVMEDAAGNKYYVVEFIKRYLDETSLVDARVIYVNPGEGQAILDEWKAGDGTEDSFITLYRTYSAEDASLQANDGLVRNLSSSGMQEDMANWLFDESRKSGDTTVITLEAENPVEYVIYYVGLGDPQWKATIKTTLLTEIINNYVDQLTAGMTVEDPNGNLPYIKIIEEASKVAADLENATSGTAETTAETQAAQ